MIEMTEAFQKRLPQQEEEKQQRNEQRFEISH